MNPLFDDFRKAQSRLSRRDPILGKVVKAVGACTLQPNPDGFNILVRAIISQMISTKAAASIAARLERELCPGGLQPGAILAATPEQLRAVGLSGSKVRALHDLAGRVESGLVPLDDLEGRPDDEIVSLLTPVRGIGVWTAQMFLIFSLGRLDVLPVDDLGLRAGVRDVYGLPEMPGRAYLIQAAEKWQPYRTVATWYFWKSRGFVPQSE